jgi:hypothetical protein
VATATCASYSSRQHAGPYIRVIHVDFGCPCHVRCSPSNYRSADISKPKLRANRDHPHRGKTAQAWITRSLEHESAIIVNAR